MEPPSFSYPSVDFSNSSLSSSNVSDHSPTSSLSAPSYQFPAPQNSFSSQPQSNSFIELQKSSSPSNSLLGPVSSPSPVSDNTASNSALDDVQRRMEEMKINQQNLKKLQEERKNLQENLSAPNISQVSSPSPAPVSSQADAATVQLSMDLVNSMTTFMTKVDSKLQSLENQLRKLTVDFHQACSKEEQNTELFAQKLRTLKEQLDQTRSAMPSPSESKPQSQSNSSPSFNYPVLSQPEPVASPFVPPPYNAPPSVSTGVSQEDADAAIAKQLQEQFDNEQRAELAQQAAQQARASQQQQQVHRPPVQNFAPPSQPQSQPPSSGATRENCPVCGLSFTVGKELMEHTDSHFRDQSSPQQPQQRVVMNTQQQQQQQNNEPGFFAKIFGAKPKQETRPVYYAPAPQQVQQPPPQTRVSYYPGTNQPVPQGQQPQQVYMSSNGVPMYMPTQPR